MISVIDNEPCLLALWNKNSRLNNVTRSQIVIKAEEQCEDIFKCHKPWAYSNL